MANIFTLENVSDFSEKLNIDELYEKKRQYDLNKLTLFNKILNRIHVRIKTTSRQKTDEHFCWFLVPEVIIGVPKYDQPGCIAYLMDKLQENKFNVKYVHPNTLFISWIHWVPSYVRTELKKKTGIIINEFGEKIDETNNQDKDKSNYESTSIHLYTTYPLISLEKDKNNINNIYWIPFCSLVFNYKEPQKLYPFNKDRKLCGYCNSNPIKFREDFVDLLANKDSTNGVYALGKCIGTSKKINIKKLEGTYSTDNMYKEYSNYAFIICMENKIDDGYVTEKIFNAYKAGSIPIYWGDSSTAKKLFNPKSFVCINDFKSTEDCIDYIINLYNDKKRLIEMASEPMFTNNIIPDILQIDNYINPPNIYLNISKKIII
jgi:hypothetical protein